MPSIRPLLGSLLLAASLTVVACASSTDVATPDAAEPTTETAAANSSNPEELTPVRFTLSWLFQAVDAPLAIALDKGYFAEAGLDVTYERGFGSADSITKIAAGQYDIGEGDMYSMMEFNEKNPDQQLVAVAIKFNRSPFVIVTKADEGVDSPADLSGKNLAAPAGDDPAVCGPCWLRKWAQIPLRWNGLMWNPNCGKACWPRAAQTEFPASRFLAYPC